MEPPMNSRRMITYGATAGALAATALLPLVFSPIARADPGDETTTVLGSSPFTETIVTDPDHNASDTFLSTPFYDSESYIDLHTDRFADIVTFPGLFQEVFIVQPDASTGSELFEFDPIFNPADFLNPDQAF